MRVLLIDTTQYYPSSPLFHEALEELSAERGWEYRFLDEAPFLQNVGRSLIHRAVYRLLGRRPLTYWSFNLAFKRLAAEFRPDVVLVVKGAYIAPEALEWIRRSTNAILINYATDDPFNPRVNTRDLVASVPLYDLYACTKRAIIADVIAAGCRGVTWVPFGYKPAIHFPEAPRIGPEPARFAADVAFAGGLDRDRLPYIRELIRMCPGVRVRLYGGYWDRCRDLRPYHGGIVYGREYRLALGASRVALNLVRRANRDGHVMRSFEIPACGVFMLAERTAEHSEFFSEAEEMACFDGPAEMVEKVRYYLERPGERDRIRKAAYQKVIAGGHTYKDRLCAIFSEVGMG